MTAQDIFIPLTIYLLIPLTGIIGYMGLNKRMCKVPAPPTLDFFIIFATFGGLLLLALTSLFWQWSGMASLGTFYLIFIAPIVMGLISFSNRKYTSNYRKWAFLLGLSYFVIAPAVFFIIFKLSDS